MSKNKKENSKSKITKEEKVKSESGLITQKEVEGIKPLEMLAEANLLHFMESPEEDYKKKLTKGDPCTKKIAINFFKQEHENLNDLQREIVDSMVLKLISKKGKHNKFCGMVIKSFPSVKWEDGSISDCYIPRTKDIHISPVKQFKSFGKIIYRKDNVWKIFIHEGGHAVDHLFTKFSSCQNLLNSVYQEFEKKYKKINSRQIKFGNITNPQKYSNNNAKKLFKYIRKGSVYKKLAKTKKPDLQIEKRMGKLVNLLGREFQVSYLDPFFDKKVGNGGYIERVKMTEEGLKVKELFSFSQIEELKKNHGLEIKNLREKGLLSKEFKENKKELDKFYDTKIASMKKLFGFYSDMITSKKISTIEEAFKVQKHHAGVTNKYNMKKINSLEDRLLVDMKSLTVSTEDKKLAGNTTYIDLKLLPEFVSFHNEFVFDELGKSRDTNQFKEKYISAIKEIPEESRIILKEANKDFIKTMYLSCKKDRLIEVFDIISKSLNIDLEKTRNKRKLRQKKALESSKKKGTSLKTTKTKSTSSTGLGENAWNKRKESSYRYQTEDIQTIQNIIMKEYQNKFLIHNVLGDNNDINTYLLNFIKNAEEKKKAGLCIYNLGDYHWVTFAVIPSEKDTTVLYKDSRTKDTNGNDLPDNSKLKNLLESQETKIIFNQGHEQTGGLECGIFALKNMEIMAKNLQTKDDFIKEFKNYKNFCSLDEAKKLRQEQFAKKFVIGTYNNIIEEYKKQQLFMLKRKHYQPEANLLCSTLQRDNILEELNIIIVDVKKSFEDISKDKKKMIGIEIGSKSNDINSEHIYRICLTKDIVEQSGTIAATVAKALGIEAKNLSITNNVITIDPTIIKNMEKQKRFTSDDIKIEELKLDYLLKTTKEKPKNDKQVTLGEILKLTTKDEKKEVKETLEEFKTEKNKHLKHTGKKIVSDSLEKNQDIQQNKRYSFKDRLVENNSNNDDLVSKLTIKSVISSDVELKAIKANPLQKEIEKTSVSFLAEEDHSKNHGKNVKSLIDDVKSGKIVKDTVIAMERKQYGNNFGVKDVILIANILDHNEKHPKNQIKLPDEIKKKSLIYHDALLYKECQKHGVKIIGLEGKNLKVNKNSPQYNQEREKYMSKVIHMARENGYNVVAHVGSAHVDNLQKLLSHKKKINKVFGKKGMASSLIEIKNQVKNSKKMMSDTPVRDNRNLRQNRKSGFLRG